jgi:glutamine synthetase
MRTKPSEFTRVETSVLLYVETCLVDNQGRMNQVRMNKEDFDALDTLKAEGMLDYGRLPEKEIEKYMKLLGRFQTSTHWVSFTEEAWVLVAIMRRERAERGKVQLQAIMGSYA